MPFWSDLYKLWTYAFEKDPLSRRTDDSGISGAGVTQPEAIPDIRQDGSFWGGGKGLVRLRDTNDFIDLSTVSNRKSRYKEYERLRNVPEIETAMTVFADEACLAGSTKIATVAEGLVSIKKLAETKTEPFLVYCWDFDKNDYTIGWAYDPRYVKTDETIKIKLDNGKFFVCTTDHEILKRDGTFIEAGEIKEGDELMPFYKIPANYELTKIKTKQFPRIFTFTDGWKHERQFIDEWRLGHSIEKYSKVNEACRALATGLSTRKIAKIMGHQWFSIDSWIAKEGFSTSEVKWLGNKKDVRRVIGVHKHSTEDVYDLSVEKHMNFCGDSCVFHNCQRGDNNHVFDIICKDDDVKKELDFLFFHRKMLNMDRRIWSRSKNLFIMGDEFWEIVIDPDNPKDGILKIQELPPDSMFRIETTKGKLVEFQQAKEGPDYQALTKAPIPQATESSIQQSKALRFTPDQIIHMKIGDDRKTFYPYGQSLIEPARGPAHQLRLMEDAMVVYRLCLAGNTRVRTANGWKYIKELKKGDEVFSYSASQRKVISSKVTDWTNNGKQKTYKVRSKHIEITGNATHPIWVERNGIQKYVLIKDLVPKKDMLLNITRDEETLVEIPKIFGEKWAKLDGSQKIAFRNINYYNKSELMRQCLAKDDRVKQFLYLEGKALPYEQAVNICEKFELDPDKLLIVNKGQINSERINTPKYVDEEFARLFGFLIGDGCVRDNGYQVGFAGGVNPDQNEYYANLMEKFFGKVKFQIDNRSSKNLGNYVVNSAIACKIFNEMGYITGAHNKRIPKWVFSASKSIRKAFVEGISNADGCERYTKAGLWFYAIELCNKNLVADIKEVWSSIGLCSGNLGHRKSGHEIVAGRKMPSSECYKVTISDKVLPEKENIWSICEDKEQDVFDITVDNEEHNFIANGTIVHNSRAPERRVFYIDVGTLPPYKAEAFIERLKDQFRKKKVSSRTGTSQSGASAVEERWHARAADEDYWLPIRPNANTRIDTLPGAQNLGEIDDAVYFRNKLFTALNFPKNYMSNEDVQTTRIALSAQDCKFARLVERLQSHMEDGLWAVADRHLQLRGFPEESWEDLVIKLTPPSDWRELSRAEVVSNRINNANSLKGSMLMSDFDILTSWMKLNEDEVEDMMSRMKVQKLEDMKLQVLAQNPQLLGVGVPGIGEQEVSAEGPSQMPPEQSPGSPEQSPGGPEIGTQPTGTPPTTSSGITLPKPSTDDLKKYDLQIQTYSSEQDHEDIDFSIK